MRSASRIRDKRRDDKTERQNTATAPFQGVGRERMAFGKVTNPKSESYKTVLTGRLKLPVIVHRRKSEDWMAHTLQRADRNWSFV